MQSNSNRFITAVCGTFLALAATVAPHFSGVANAQTPSHIYELNGSYTDALGGPSLTAGTSVIGATGASFSPNPGLLLTGGFASPTTYSVEMYFQIDTTANYRKLLDFKNRSLDSGLYNQNTTLRFFEGGTVKPGNQSPAGVINANQMTHLVFTRDGATGQVNGYINGNTTPAISFTDTGAFATLTGVNSPLYFFTDDSAVAGEASAGFVDYIRTYDTALTATQARTVYQANVTVTVPEVSTLPLFGSVASLAGCIVLARRRKSA